MPPQQEPGFAEGQPGRQRNQHPETGVEFEHRRDICDGSRTHELQQYSRAASMVSLQALTNSAQCFSSDLSWAAGLPGPKPE